jgi:hypothetical protein
LKDAQDALEEGIEMLNADEEWDKILIIILFVKQYIFYICRKI